MLSEHGDGSSGLSMKDKDGESRVLLYTNAYGPSLVLGDKDGKTRASLRVTADGSPTLKILDKEGITRAGVGVTVLETTKTGATTQTAESSVVLFDKEGTVIFKAPTR